MISFADFGINTHDYRPIITQQLTEKVIWGKRANKAIVTALVSSVALFVFATAAVLSGASSFCVTMMGLSCLSLVGFGLFAAYADYRSKLAAFLS